MATNRNASTASRLSKIAAAGKGRASDDPYRASDLAQSKSARVGRALSTASRTIGAFGSRPEGESEGENAGK